MRLLALLLVLLATGPARANDKVAFGLDWKAEAEYGGYYQALATGLYARRGLDVTIQEGGPQLNHMQLMIAGRLDFNLSGGRAIEFAAQKLPFLAVAAMFQRDLSVLLTHPGMGNDTFESLRGKPILIGGDTRNGWWRFLAAKYGFTDSQIRPYTYNMAPFLADRNAAQEGYVSNEPFLIRQKAGFDPVVLGLPEAGYLGYANLITTSQKLVDRNPDLVRRFVDASIEGWYSYLYGDPAPGNALIRQANPEMTADLMAYGRATMIARGTVDSGDAKTLGIGAMTDARWKAFYDSMVAVGVYQPSIDLTKGYTTRFVNHRVGMINRTP